MLIIGIFLSACLFGITAGIIYIAVMVRSEAMQRAEDAAEKDVDNPQ